METVLVQKKLIPKNEIKCKQINIFQKHQKSHLFKHQHIKSSKCRLNLENWFKLSFEASLKQVLLFYISNAIVNMIVYLCFLFSYNILSKKSCLLLNMLPSFWVCKNTQKSEHTNIQTTYIPRTNVQMHKQAYEHTDRHAHL